MSPNEPEPIFLINLYLPPTMNSFFAIDIANDAMSLLSSVCLLSLLHHSIQLFSCAETSIQQCSFAPAPSLTLSPSRAHSSTVHRFAICLARSIFFSLSHYLVIPLMHTGRIKSCYTLTVAY